MLHLFRQTSVDPWGGQGCKNHRNVGRSKSRCGGNQGGNHPRDYVQRRRHPGADEKKKSDNEGSDPYESLERIHAGSAEHFHHGDQSFHCCAFAGESSYAPREATGTLITTKRVSS